MPFPGADGIVSMRYVSLLLLLFLASPRALLAQELEPRFYANVPVDTNVLVIGYARSEGGVLFDASIELENADLAIDGPYVGYARSLSIGDVTGKFDVGIANVCLDGTADFEGETVSRDVCGWSDAKLRFAVNFFGSPALSAREFAAYRQNLVAGASLQLTAPVGDYDPESLVNIGTNRWSARAEVGLSKAVERWLLEFALSGTFYQDNDDFFGGRLREQDPIYAVQAHIVRRFDRGAWLAFDYTRYRGGDTKTDGLPNANLQSNARAGLTLALPIGRRHTLKFNASSGILTRTGSDFDTVGASWAYTWGI